jgi:hypothetical protein
VVSHVLQTDGAALRRQFTRAPSSSEKPNSR